MESNDKDRSRARAARSIGKESSYEEKRQHREALRRKYAERERKRPRERDWGDDAAERAPIRATSRLRPAAPEEDTDAVETALVVGVARTLVRVRTEAGEIDAERVPGRAADIAVGDQARMEARGERRWRVVGIEARRTWLSRPDPANARRELVLAANVDAVAVVVSVVAPPLRPALVDRVAIAVERGGARLLVCVNKIDLVDANARAELDAARAGWSELGFDAHEVSATTGAGLDRLREAFDSRRVVLVGHSGVGKSSLVNALTKRAARIVGAVRERDGTGCHTTTSSELILLWPGTELVDTAGVREFGLGALTPLEATAAMPDIAQLARACRFRDCSHIVEPDCAVRAAAEDAGVLRARFELYLRVVTADTWKEFPGRTHSAIARWKRVGLAFR